MAKIIYAIGIFIVVLAGVIFAIKNADTVTLNYYFGTSQVPLSLAIILSMFIGAILGVLASMGLLLKHRKEISRLKKNAQMAEKEIANLRTIPLKEEH